MRARGSPALAKSRDKGAADVLCAQDRRERLLHPGPHGHARAARSSTSLPNRPSPRPSTASRSRRATRPRSSTRSAPSSFPSTGRAFQSGGSSATGRSRCSTAGRGSTSSSSTRRPRPSTAAPRPMPARSSSAARASFRSPDTGPAARRSRIWSTIAGSRSGSVQVKDRPFMVPYRFLIGTRDGRSRGLCDPVQHRLRSTRGAPIAGLFGSGFQSRSEHNRRRCHKNVAIGPTGPRAALAPRDLRLRAATQSNMSWAFHHATPYVVVNGAGNDRRVSDSGRFCSRLVPTA